MPRNWSIMGNEYHICHVDGNPVIGKLGMGNNEPLETLTNIEHLINSVYWGMDLKNCSITIDGVNFIFHGLQESVHGRTEQIQQVIELELT